MKKRTKKILIFGIVFVGYVVCRIIKLIPSYWDLALFIILLLGGGLCLRYRAEEQK